MDTCPRFWSEPVLPNDPFDALNYPPQLFSTLVSSSLGNLRSFRVFGERLDFFSLTQRINTIYFCAYGNLHIFISQTRQMRTILLRFWRRRQVKICSKICLVLHTLQKHTVRFHMLEKSENCHSAYSMKTPSSIAHS